MIISELKRIFLNEKSYQNGTGAYPEVSPFKKKKFESSTRKQKRGVYYFRFFNNKYRYSTIINNNGFSALKSKLLFYIIIEVFELEKPS